MFFDGNISKMARVVGVSQPALRDIMSERATTPGYQTLIIIALTLLLFAHFATIYQLNKNSAPLSQAEH